MSRKNVLDSLLDALNLPNGVNGILSPPQKTSLSDKIPSAHSDLIITMILRHQNELFADNRKRKPIFNARRKAKWNELVENLNSDLNMEYSVERVKNNYHYRITSLKRNITKITSTLNDGEEIEECAAFQNLSEIDRLLYEAVKSTCIENNSNEVAPAKKKKMKSEKSLTNDKIDDTYSTTCSPALFSNEDQILDNQCQMSSNVSKSEEPEEEAINDYVEELDLNKSLTQMIRTQVETLDTMKQFMKEQMVHQAKILELINSSTEVLKETATNLSRQTNPSPCPTCTENFFETILQACTTNSNQKLVSNLLPKKQNLR